MNEAKVQEAICDIKDKLTHLESLIQIKPKPKSTKPKPIKPVTAVDISSQILSFSDEEDPQDILDYLSAGYSTGLVSRCSGGRYILTGYICIHCQSESPNQKCMEPKPSWAKK